MSADGKKTALPLYVVVLIGAALVVLYVFMRNFRAGEEAAAVAPPPSEPRTTSAKAVDQQALARDMNLAGRGKGLFEINCASCHGATGNGDGARAASINPKPRNYHTETFKFGNDLVSIQKTILRGSPGTSMPSFSLLPIEDTWAMAHYVYTLIPNPPPLTDAQVATLPGGDGSAAATPATATPAPASAPATTPAKGSPTAQKPAAPANADLGAPKPVDSVRVPIEVAMMRIAAAGPMTPPVQVRSEAKGAGAELFAMHCARCHGAQGEGTVNRVLAVSPYRYDVTNDLTTSTSVWVTDRNKFSQLVVQGLPGRSMPGQATLSAAQVDALYSFVRGLAKTR
jgi:mono/diheme cytochrome c family protein